jgi:hypothetical protein
MDTNQKLTDSASEFRGWAKGRLAARRVSVGHLARKLRKSRGAVSRAINRGEFPRVQKAIRRELAA